MRQIATTNKYRKDWELAKRRNLPIQELNDETMLCEVIMLAIGSATSDQTGF